jgi:orotate phosphoribosyltransferase
MEDHARLRSLLAERSLAFGDFTLASGAKSTYYVDARLTTMSAEGQALIGSVGLDAIRVHWPEARWVGGLTLGADPIAYAIAHRSWIAGDPIAAFTVRKKAKDHGTTGLIEGGLRSGEPVVVVEDTLTSGSSALQAVAAVEGFGSRVLGVLTLVDREVGGREKIADAGHEAVALFTASELLKAAGRPPA